MDAPHTIGIDEIGALEIGLCARHRRPSKPLVAGSNPAGRIP
jgi:hypothetical protein